MENNKQEVEAWEKRRMAIIQAYISNRIDMETFIREFYEIAFIIEIINRGG